MKIMEKRYTISHGFGRHIVKQQTNKQTDKQTAI